MNGPFHRFLAVVLVVIGIATIFIGGAFLRYYDSELGFLQNLVVVGDKVASSMILGAVVLVVYWLVIKKRT